MCARNSVRVQMYVLINISVVKTRASADRSWEWEQVQVRSSVTRYSMCLLASRVQYYSSVVRTRTRVETLKYDIANPLMIAAV
jgi:hypothetical protein